MTGVNRKDLEMAKAGRSTTKAKAGVDVHTEVPEGKPKKAAKVVKKIEIKAPPKVSETPINLTEMFTIKPAYQKFWLWIVGETPLITHAWSLKAKLQMMAKQVQATTAQEARDPDADFLSSLYDMGDGKWGFPTMGLKNCIIASAHKDKGVPKVTAQAALWLDAKMYAVQPALEGAVCNMPLTRIYGSEPRMREDMVRVGGNTANFAYRAEFEVWACLLAGRFNASVINATSLAYLIEESGMACGIGDWRNEKSGVFGSFRLATAKESAAWDAFAKGKGPLPIMKPTLVAAE